ncbi:uncharacterized protein LOC124279850 [Haliotis rubra]|uniref:uncharacterized protein LOC124279850 n=1 Tax=Haliotis rubra TaxID=36100 RepID=UPI001EE60AAA|nr:uncharacterized protein LOC124279850 [Haliotis rubra]
MANVTYCLTYLFTLGVNIVSVTSAKNNWDLPLEKLHEDKGTVRRRLVKFYKFLVGVVLIVAVGYSAYIYSSLSRLKPGDKMNILTFCRVAPITPDKFIWNIVKLLVVFLNTFAITRMYALLAFYFLAAYHIVREFKLLQKKAIDLKQHGHCVTFDIIKDLRLQYKHSVSLTKILDSLVTWQAFLCYSLLLPNIFVFLYGVLRVPSAREEFPIEIEFLMGTCIYITVLTLTGTSINTASKGMEDVLYQIGIDWSDDKTTRAYQMFLYRVSTSDVGITALGFFTINKGTVLTMVGTIVSYVIVILQSPTGSDTYQDQPNGTLHP